ncbi:hypothetical protein [Nonlabens sp. Asnod3-A02]|uniref:hypothetical protein n=1 Tax=Nonlabens sp. Asnod3-A02 TaxID=3160579 RepID=UPI003868FCF6
MHILSADQLELTTRGLIDKATGTDAIAMIQGNVYGISLRVRSSDYNSFTLSRNINDIASEVKKWCKNRSNKIKPAYHVQISERADNTIKVTRINIDAFSIWLRYANKNNKLEQYYNKKLLAYEFALDNIPNADGIFTDIYPID